MTRRPPIVATTIVLLAVATMVALGFWQLDRRAEKEALLADYARAQRNTAEVAWPLSPRDYPRALYRHARVTCAEVEAVEPMAGRSASGRSGWAIIAQCRRPAGGGASVALGWSERPELRGWRGGEVTGIIGSAGRGIRLVASPPVAGLEPLAPPDPAAVPNNHLSYAVQWFAFAATALLIYLLALRRRGRGG